MAPGPKVSKHGRVFAVDVAVLRSTLTKVKRDIVETQNHKLRLRRAALRTGNSPLVTYPLSLYWFSTA